jgi:hypothetical protein
VPLSPQIQQESDDCSAQIGQNSIEYDTGIGSAILETPVPEIVDASQPAEIHLDQEFKDWLRTGFELSLNEAQRGVHLSGGEKNAIVEFLTNASAAQILIQSELAMLIGQDPLDNSIQIAVPAYPEAGIEIRKYLEDEIESLLSDRYPQFNEQMNEYIENLFKFFGERDQVFNIIPIPNQPGGMKISNSLMWTVPLYPDNDQSTETRLMRNSTSASAQLRSIVSGRYQFLHRHFVEASLAGNWSN